jgi:hypothetical protein
VERYDATNILVTKARYAKLVTRARYAKLVTKAR